MPAVCFLPALVSSTGHPRVNARKDGPASDCHTACAAILTRATSTVRPRFRVISRSAVAHKVEQFGREPRKEQRIGAAALSGTGKHFERPASSMAHCNADHKN